MKTISDEDYKFLEHEVLHTTYLLFDTWEEQVINHTYTQTDPELIKSAEEVFSMMWKFYQAVGAKSE